LGFTGLPWTYDNKQDGPKNVKSRIDRAVACPAWSLALPDAPLQHILSFRSDHLPLLLYLFKPQAHRNFKQWYRYEAFWEREPSLDDTIKEAWLRRGENENLGQISSSLQGVMSDLKTWSKKTIGSVHRKLDTYRKRLEILATKRTPTTKEKGKSSLLKWRNCCTKKKSYSANAPEPYG
jgi:hypothetical protein